MTIGLSEANVNLRNVDNLLFSSSDVKTRTVVIATAARYSSGTALPQGLLLGKITASGKYVEFVGGASDGTQLDAAAVVLVEPVDVVDGDVVATVVYEGTLKGDGIVGDFGNLDTALCPDLTFI